MFPDRYILVTRWHRFIRKFRADFANASDIFNRLSSKYTESHRHYHTLNHLYEFFIIFDEYRHLFTNPNIVELAIWFHDVIYNPSRSDNEEVSAEYAKMELLKLGFSQSDISQVQTIILATKPHKRTGDFDTDLMIDMDMSILGSKDARYKEYLHQIVAEYTGPGSIYHGNTAAFCHARLKRFVEPVLQQERIFITDIMHIRFESSARRNLLWEKNKTMIFTDRKELSGIYRLYRDYTKAPKEQLAADKKASDDAISITAHP